MALDAARVAADKADHEANRPTREADHQVLEHPPAHLLNCGPRAELVAALTGWPVEEDDGRTMNGVADATASDSGHPNLCIHVPRRCPALRLEPSETAVTASIVISAARRQLAVASARQPGHVSLSPSPLLSNGGKAGASAASRHSRAVTSAASGSLKVAGAQVPGAHLLTSAALIGDVAAVGLKRSVGAAIGGRLLGGGGVDAEGVARARSRARHAAETA